MAKRKSAAGKARKTKRGQTRTRARTASAARRRRQPLHPKRAEVAGRATGIAVDAAIANALGKLPRLGRKYATLGGIQIEDTGDGGGTTTHVLMYVHLP
ncbi:MAG: hypothetical protein R3E77_10210 [Steroidobacteraceae bacterium]